MDRRKSLKYLAIGSLGGTALLAGCKDDKKEETKPASTSQEQYGRTAEEAKRDEKLNSEKFFTAAEMTTLSVLCDIIIPADEHSGSATDAKVPDFIEFMVKDMPDMQTPLRGGLRWVDMKSLNMFGKSFAEAGKEKQVELAELIAYPQEVKPENRAGASFFTLLRNLAATGFFTSKIGIEDLGYKGNVANAWDGVPDDVLKQYGLSYDEKTLAQCLKIEDRGKIMEWND